jgi:hypothetical protein
VYEEIGHVVTDHIQGITKSVSIYSFVNLKTQNQNFFGFSVILQHCPPLIYYYVLQLSETRGTKWALHLPQGGGGVRVVQGIVRTRFYT